MLVLLMPLVSAQPALGTAFFESFIVIVREGLEAILIIAAIIAYLTVAKHDDKVRVVYAWGFIAVIASFLTALALDQALGASKVHEELLEGVTMLLATVVLLYVTNWLLGKVQARKWKSYIKGRVDDALASGSSLMLGLVAFLAVYREGFETVLFYKALSIGASSMNDIILGLIAGLIVLAVLFVLIVKAEKRLPLSHVFGVTSAILFALAVKFAGKGVHELQEAGIMQETILQGLPRVSDLGFYPTLETLGAQAIIILIGVVLVYLHFFKEEK